MVTNVVDLGTELENARAINEEHRKLNGTLREENRLLGNTLLDIYSLFSQIDFNTYNGELKMCFGDALEYDSIPWAKWEAVVDAFFPDSAEVAPVQLRLF